MTDNASAFVVRVTEVERPAREVLKDFRSLYSSVTSGQIQIEDLPNARDAFFKLERELGRMIREDILNPRQQENVSTLLEAVRRSLDIVQ